MSYKAHTRPTHSLRSWQCVPQSFLLHPWPTDDGGLAVRTSRAAVRGGEVKILWQEMNVPKQTDRQFYQDRPEPPAPPTTFSRAAPPALSSARGLTVRVELSLNDPRRAPHPYAQRSAAQLVGEHTRLGAPA